MTTLHDIINLGTVRDQQIVRGYNDSSGQKTKGGGRLHDRRNGGHADLSHKQANRLKAIIELTRQKDPVLLERTYESYAKQYDAINGVPGPWAAGIESTITGFHERFNPQGIKNHDAKPFLDLSFVQ